MAAGPRESSLFGTHLDCVQEKGLKGPEMDPAGKNILVTQDGSIRGFWERIAPECVKEEPEEGLRQRWESQWRQFLKAVETPSSEEGHSKQGHSGCLQSPLDVGQQLMGDEVPQLLFDSLKERQEPEDASLAEDKAASGKIKDEFPDGEGYEEVILGEDAVGWEEERQRFRQLCYQEKMGPRETYGALQDLCHEWLKPERRTKEQILEQVILEQFLAILPQEMQEWVKAHHPDSCPRAVALAESFLLLQEQKDPGPVQEEAVSSPEAEGPPWDSGEWPLFREIKQEQDSDPAVPAAGDEEMCGEKDSRGENCGEADPPWTLSGEAELTNGFKSGDAFEDLPPKRREGLTDSQRCDQVHDEETDQPKILKGETEKMGIRRREIFQCWPELMDCQLSHTEEKTYERLDCTESFCSRNTDVVPQSIHMGEKPYLCLAGGESFTDRTILAAHERTRHGDENPSKPMGADPCFPHNSLPVIRDKRAPLGERPHKCTDCEKSFGTRAILVSHRRTHTGEKPYRCPECGKCFSMASALVRHKRTHTGERPYKCLECGRCFGDRSGFNTHARIHTGEKLYRCPDCGKSFGRQAHLADHERTHTGEKPYLCPECEKRFSSLSILIKHKRTHTGEKPYRCSFCAKSFSQSSSCMKHERTHTGEKPYKCSYCGQSFSQNSSCVRHERTHSGERFFK